MPSSAPRVLITGGSGCIGTHLREYLAGRFPILSPTHQELELTDPPAVGRYLDDHPVDTVIQCADRGPQPDESGAELLAVNIKIFFTLAERLGRGVNRIIHFGSGAEYDKSRPLVRIQESAFGERIPPGEYGLCKYLIARWVEATPAALNLRLFGIFGPGENYLIKFISNAIVKNLLGQELIINQNARFSYLWVKDLPPIVEYFLRHEARHRSYNVVPDLTVELAEIVACINDVADRPSKVTFLNSGLGREYTADNRRLRAELPNLRCTELHYAVRELYKYYQNRIDQIDADAVARDEYLARLKRGSTMNL